MVKALHRGFSDSPKIRRVADHVTAHSGFYENALYKFTFTYFYLLTCVPDLSNPKSIRLRQTVEDYYCDNSSHSDQEFSFYRGT